MTATEAAARIYNTFLLAGFPDTLSRLITGQAGNESRGFTSNFFVNNNNAFGYECKSTSKWQNGCSTGNADNGSPVGNYDLVEDSANEIVDWIKRRQDEGKFPDDLSTITTADQYAQLLQDAGYYTSNEDSYAANISAWVNKLGSAFQDALTNNPASLVLVVLIVAGGIYAGVKYHFFRKIFKR